MSTATLHEDVTGKKKLKIISRGENHWRVRIVFPTLEASDSEMVNYLREAKKLIYITDGVPTKSLELEEVLSKTRTDEGVAVDVSIGRIEVKVGKPIVRLRELELSTQTVFDSMLASVDFSYADENDQTMTTERIRRELDLKKIDFKLCDFGKLETEVKRVVDKKSYSKGYVVAEGKLPDKGADAEIEYTFVTDLGSADDMNEYRESRKVKQGDVLCQKIHAKVGVNPGVNVFGKEIPPVKGSDFELVPGLGVELSYDGTLVKATMNGVATLKKVQRTIHDKKGERKELEKVEIVVKPLIQVDGSKVENLNTDESVEIKGSLRKGAKINTGGDLFLDGDIDHGAVVRARSDVMINGDIRGGDVASDDSIHATKDAKGSNIAARNDVYIEGDTENSTVTGKRVTLGSVVGSEITASQKVTILSAGDGSGTRSKIKVGSKDFYQKIIETNEKTIASLGENLGKINTLLGEEYVTELNETNVQHVLIQYLKDYRKRTGTDLSPSRVGSIKHLMESVLPIKRIIIDKTSEIRKLKLKADEKDTGKPVVLIREKINDSLSVTMGGKVANIPPTDGGAMITPDSNGNIQSLPLGSKKSQIKVV